MQCKKCNAQADCIDTREKQFTRWRRYRCACGNSFTSVEVTEGMSDFSSFGTQSTVYKWFAAIQQDAEQRGMKLAQAKIRRALGIVDK